MTHFLPHFRMNALLPLPKKGGEALGRSLSSGVFPQYKKLTHFDFLPFAE